MDKAIAMGYDPATMTECGVIWSDHQDPFNHVTNAQFPHYATVCNFRVFESFAAQLGPENYRELKAATGRGVLVKKYMLDIKRPVTYPDSVSPSL